MIKAAELRLGNLVQADKEHYNQFHDHGRVTSIFNNESEADRFTIDYHYPGKWFEPIPLTPEWLERWGWQVVDQGNGPYYWLEKQCWFHVHLSADGSLYANFNNNAIPINHLHQLQNLYFTLTGEELTIKETV